MTEPAAESERQRLRRIYEAYRRNSAKQRAWAADNPGNAAIRQEVMDALEAMLERPLPTVGRILDAGCGTGWLLAALCGRGAPAGHLAGIDALPDRVAAARARAPGTAVCVGDVRRLPFESASFAVVCLFTVLSALASPDDVRATLRESRRVAASGGAVIIWEPRVPTPGNPHTRRIQRSDLELLGTDLRSRTLTVAPPIARRLGPRTDRLYPVLAAVPFIRTHRLSVVRISSDAST